MSAEESVWSAERIALLRQLWAEGWAASDIANRLGGGLTRSAVLGKRFRLNLPTPTRRMRSGGRPADPAKVKARSRRPKAAKPDRRNGPAYVKAPADVRPHVHDLAIPETQRRTLLTRDHGECCFPVGDPRDPGFFYCGAAVEPGFSYCVDHRARMFSKTS